PYRVFPSTVRMEIDALKLCSFQRFDPGELDDYILWRYRDMYDAFFADRALIPRGHYTELSYEDLIADRVGALEAIYRELSLDASERVRPVFRHYVDSTADYRVNAHPALPRET